MTIENFSISRAFNAGLFTVTLILAGSGTAVSAESSPTLAMECARRDLQVLTSIEQHSEARDLPVEQLAAAFFTMLDARRLCTERLVPEALALYERALPHSLASRPVVDTTR